jgi:hypothetical protein
VVEKIIAVEPVATGRQTRLPELNGIPLVISSIRIWSRIVLGIATMIKYQVN